MPQRKGQPEGSCFDSHFAGKLLFIRYGSCLQWKQTAVCVCCLLCCQVMLADRGDVAAIHVQATLEPITMQLIVAHPYRYLEQFASPLVH